MKVKIKLSSCTRDTLREEMNAAASPVSPVLPDQIIADQEPEIPLTPSRVISPVAAEALFNNMAIVDPDDDMDVTTEPFRPNTWSSGIGVAFRDTNAENDVMLRPGSYPDEERKQWIKDAQSKGLLFPDTGHVTPQMAGKVIDFSRPKDCTTPKVTRDDRQNTEEALAWYKALLALLEWELQAQAKDLTGPPKPALFKTDVAQTAWWADRIPPRALELISARYDSAPHAVYLTSNEAKRAYEKYETKNVLYDPFLAPFWALNWRMEKLQAMCAGQGHDVTDNDLQKLNVPLEPFIYWIALEMRHNLLLMAESNRMDEFNLRIDDHTTPSMWVSGNLIDRARYSPEEPEQPLGAYAWNPDRDAMFRYEKLKANGYYVTNRYQPFWCDYAPQPGLKGQGPPPDFKNYTDFLGSLARVLEGWNNWNMAAYMDPKERFLDPEPSKTEEVRAMTLGAEPLQLYCPEQTLLQAGKPAFEKQTISPCGPGTGKKWPAGITSGGNTRPDQSRKFAKTKHTYMVLSRPVDLPITGFEPAGGKDIKDMDLGCSQGCGREATFRYRSDPEKEPKHYCPFCQDHWHNRALVNAHLDTCKQKPHNWFRTEDQHKNFQPPVPSSSCGHSFCSYCANVSMVTAPPYACCTVCGEVAKCIKIREGAEIGVPSRPLKGDGPDHYEAPLEVWREKNPLNHHRNRYALITGRFPAKVSSANWETTYAMGDAKKQLPPPKLEGTTSSNDLTATVAKLQKQLKRSDQTKEALYTQVRPCLTQPQKASPLTNPPFIRSTNWKRRSKA